MFLGARVVVALAAVRMAPLPTDNLTPGARPPAADGVTLCVTSIVITTSSSTIATAGATARHRHGQ